jgi:hypothetical protein
MRAMVARRAWRERREALAALVAHAACAAAGVHMAQRGAAWAVQRRLGAAVWRWRWVTAWRGGGPHRRRESAVEVARRLQRGWRRWRATIVLRAARRLRARAATTLAERRRKLRGLTSIVEAACVVDQW